MCDPVTLTIAATVVTMAGQGMQALQANKQAKYEAKIAKRNSALANEAAGQELENTRTAALEHYRKVAALKGQQRATAGANGVSVDFGSPADVIDDTDMLAREDVKRIYDQGFQKSRGFEIDASNYTASARASRQAAKNALVNGAFQMAGTALGGAKQYSTMSASRAGSAATALSFSSVYGARTGPA